MRFTCGLLAVVLVTLGAQQACPDAARDRGNALLGKHTKVRDDYRSTSLLGSYMRTALIGWGGGTITSDGDAYTSSGTVYVSVLGSITKATQTTRIDAGLMLVSATWAQKVTRAGKTVSDETWKISKTSGGYTWKHTKNGRATSRKLPGPAMPTGGPENFPRLMLDLQVGKPYTFDVLHEQEGRVSQSTYTLGRKQTRTVRGRRVGVHELRFTRKRSGVKRPESGKLYIEAKTGDIVEASIASGMVTLYRMSRGELSERFGGDGPPKSIAGSSDTTQAVDDRSPADVVCEMLAAQVRRDRKTLLACMDLKELFFDEMYKGRGTQKQRAGFDMAWAVQGKKLTDQFVKTILGQKLPAGMSKASRAYRKYCTQITVGTKATVTLDMEGLKQKYRLKKRGGSWRIVKVG